MSIVIQERDLEDLNEDEKVKYKLVREKFLKEFNQVPEFYARAPGRVNLIGEHIDYCGYSVLPMAISNDIIIGCSKNSENRLNLTNVDSQYDSYACSSLDFQISDHNPKWYNYFLCGLKGIVENFNLANPIGLNICILGTIPKSSGLSSSSALVVCSALSVLIAHKLQMTRTQLAELCASSERYIGTQGGGMDQAISCLGKQGTAKLIDFNPLKVSDISLPVDCLFVIKNSCVEANKAASNHFNRRVVECRLGAQLLAKYMNLNWKEIKKIKDLQMHLRLNFEEMLSLLRDKIHEQIYTKQEICDILCVTSSELASTSLSANTLDVAQFELYKRVFHVLSEAKRVHDFKDCCSMKSDDALIRLGQLMNESHASCRDLYECSCDELDELTEICRQNGAYGSRLTGAGWGGCAVSLIPKKILNTFLANVKASYYDKKGLSELKFQSVAFATIPSDGISVLKLPDTF